MDFQFRSIPGDSCSTTFPDKPYSVYSAHVVRRRVVGQTRGNDPSLSVDVVITICCLGR